MKTLRQEFRGKKKPFYRIWSDDLSLFLRAFKERDSLVNKGPFDFIHELAHYESTAY